MSTRSTGPSPSAHIATALLLPQDRIPRLPMGPWIATLRRSVVGLRAHCRTVTDLSEKAGIAGNNASLLAALRGERRVAVALCERQMWWQHRLSRRARRDEVSRCCLQPWVNLARLSAMVGEWETAVSRLRRLRLSTQLVGIALHPLRSDGLGCRHIPRDGGHFDQVVRTIYVVDTLRALLMNRRFDEVLDFSGEVHRTVPPELGLWALEASVVAACSLGDVDGARRAAREALRREETTGWKRMLFRLRLAEVEACDGDEARAQEVLTPLVHASAQLSPNTYSVLQPLYILARLATACVEAGMPKQGAHVASRVYDGARAAGDEVFELEALRVLAVAAPGAECAAWGDALAELEGRTEYRQYRTPGAPPPDPGEFDALLHDMSALYAS